MDTVTEFHTKIVELQGQIGRIVNDFQAATKEATIDDVLKEVRGLAKDCARRTHLQNNVMVDQLDEQTFLIVACVVMAVLVATYFCCLFNAQLWRRCTTAPRLSTHIPVFESRADVFTNV